MITSPTPLAPPATITALADHVSGPVATAAVVVVGVALILILAGWLARKLVSKIIGVAVSVGVAAATTHQGMQQWIHHLVAANLHT
jgi:hypothetical protein